MQKEQQQLAALVRGKKVAFIGAGVSHKALIEEFVGLGAEVTLCDKKPSVEAFGDYAGTIRRLGVRLSLGENYMDGFRGQDIILRTPGFEYYQKPLQDAIAAGTMVTSEVELFFDLCPCEIVAVTGSDGKTTTTTLISEMFKAAGRTVHLGGNIGAPLLPMLPEVAPTDVAVVELSSFQLISMRKSPTVAVVTNVTPNHLDHHKDMQEYIDAKRNILLYQTPPCRAVLGYENDITRAMQADCKGEQVWFTRLRETDNGAFLRGDGMLCMAEGGKVTTFLAQKDVKLRGLHNIENLLAAAAAVWGRVPVEAIRQVGSTFTGGGTPHRAGARAGRRDLVQRFHRHQPHPHHRGAAQLRPEDHPHRGGLRQKDPLRAAGPRAAGPRQDPGADGGHRAPHRGGRPGRAGLCRKRPCHPPRRQHGAGGGPGPQRGQTGGHRQPVPGQRLLRRLPQLRGAGQTL